jgi:hypothetical protein
MSEDEQIYVVSRYHRRRRPRAPKPEFHVAVHVIVETQIAQDDPALVAPTVARLQAEGLDRHQAVHAVATILTPLLASAGNESMSSEELAKAYDEGLARMTAERWRRQEY